MNENETSCEPEAPFSGPSDNAKDGISQDTASAEKPTTKPAAHPIGQAIDILLHSVRDIESLARIYVPLSVRRKIRALHQVKIGLTKNAELLPKDDQSSQIVMMTKVLDALQKFERLRQSDTPRMLQSSLFLGMFSAYDIFTGELLAAIYAKKPALFKMVNRAIPVSEILQYDSFENLKTVVLQTEIETFRRKSYVEQFEDLQTTFGLELKAFQRWPQFVECGQRRNLMTHCGGIVSDQYLKVCLKEGYSFPSPIKAGEKLKLDNEYLLTSCELIMEVGFELGQTLWRKIFPDEIGQADDHLSDVIYGDCLRVERWERAVVFGEFAVNQKRSSTDVKRKICIINYAIGLKFAGRPEEANKVLAKVDWSGAATEFKLGEAVLTDRYDDAANLMKRIGKEGEFVRETSYHEWPLFHEFRKTAQFLDTYESIYGYPFAVELQRAASKAQAGTSEEIEKETTQDTTLLGNGAAAEEAKDKSPVQSSVLKLAASDSKTVEPTP